MSLKNGDFVVINKCDVCPAIVGKVAKVVGITLNDSRDPEDRVQLNFGRGRPQRNRPISIPIEDVSIDRSSDVTCSVEVSNEDNCPRS